MTAEATVKPSRKIALSLCETHSHGPLGYLEMGRADGPCVVFLHGFGADLLTWQLCLVPLASQYRIVAIDLPGHGRTTADVGEASLSFMTGWLDEAFDALDIRDAHIVGHSMGAKIALGFALSHPERVSSLGLISPAGLGGDFHHDRLDAFLVDTSHAEALAEHLLGPQSANLIPGLVRSLTEAARADDRRDALHRLLGQARTYGLALSPEGFDWSKIRVPVMILWGASDQLIPMPAAHRLPPRSTLHVLDGIGHLPHMEASGAVVSALKEFLP
jgi:pimeloyl-ACP methyl ester carboxylesterase